MAIHYTYRMIIVIYNVGKNNAISPPWLGIVEILPIKMVIWEMVYDIVLPTLFELSLPREKIGSSSAAKKTCFLQYSHVLSIVFHHSTNMFNMEYGKWKNRAMVPIVYFYIELSLKWGHAPKSSKSSDHCIPLYTSHCLCIPLMTID